MVWLSEAGDRQGCTYAQTQIKFTVYNNFSRNLISHGHDFIWYVLNAPPFSCFSQSYHRVYGNWR